MSPSDSYPQHVVTAVIVAHDGAAWLPGLIDSLLDQTRPVQRLVAVDVGSRDRSGAVLASRLGQAVVFGMDRRTGYGRAVSRALQHKAANVSVPGMATLPPGERTEWIWLLHDDCEPARDALDQLLRGAAETRSAAVIGPKLKDWSDRDVIVEAGVTIDTVGRRITGIEPREVDQGQHDGDRDCVAVSSAGMLVRRDVWEQVGGFDQDMGLFMEDVDFCWRAHAAGYRVRVITDAVVYHAQASARNRRPVSVGRRPRLLERRNALIALLGNLPALPLLRALAGNLGVSGLRTLFFLLAKRPAAALDETAAMASVLCHPLRLLRIRRRRAGGRRPAYGRLRADLPPGRSLRRIAEFAAAAMSRSAQLDTAGSHHASDDPNEDDSLLTDTGLAQRILTSPAVLLFAALTVVALVAERSLLGGGPLAGGGLVPAWGGASGLWGEYLQGFHPAGIGSSTTAPPYLAVVALLGTVLGGKPWLAVEVILLGCVPLAGLGAFLAVRRLTRMVLVRVWAAATYALLPVATGAIATGRIGSVVFFMLLPLIALTAGRMFTQPHRRARRAAWATGLSLAVAAAFVPLLWAAALAAAVVIGAAVRGSRRGMMVNLGIVVLVPPVLLVPWTFQLASHPSAILLEAGLPQPGVASLPARSLLLLSPGGPGLPPAWMTAGLGFAALAALLARRRRRAIMAGWAVALAGLVLALALSRAVVRTPSAAGGIHPWTGPLLAVAAAGLLLAACAGGDALAALAARQARGPRRQAAADRRPAAAPRRVLAACVALVACSAPAVAAASWLSGGVSGPVTHARGQTVPEVVAATSGSGLQPRTLVLAQSAGHVSYSLLRGRSLSLADPDLSPPPAAERALSTAVATLVAPGGGDAASQSQTLAQFGIGFVLMRTPVSQSLAGTLDGVAGLRQVAITPTFELWRLDSLPARVRVAEPGGAVVAIPSSPVSVAGAKAPSAGGILELAEPAGAWHATLNGRPLTAVPSPAGSWAQAFRLPSGGGTLDISRSDLGHSLALLFELLAALVVAALALPGVGTGADEATATSPRARTGAAHGRAAAPAGRGVPARPPLTAAGGAATTGGEQASPPAGQGRRPAGRKGVRRGRRGLPQRAPGAAAAAGPGAAATGQQAAWPDGRQGRRRIIADPPGQPGYDTGPVAGQSGGRRGAGQQRGPARRSGAPRYRGEPPAGDQRDRYSAYRADERYPAERPARYAASPGWPQDRPAPGPGHGGDLPAAESARRRSAASGWPAAASPTGRDWPEDDSGGGPYTDQGWVLEDGLEPLPPAGADHAGQRDGRSYRPDRRPEPGRRGEGDGW
ncbi:MAG TPA: glycosyltransferase [Streptosporangiaceae bacterium]